MGRHKVYLEGTATACISLPQGIMNMIDAKAAQINKTRSEYIGLVLTRYAASEPDFAKMMAKKACSEMNYWKYIADRLEQELEIDAIKATK